MNSTLKQISFKSLYKPCFAILFFLSCQCSAADIPIIAAASSMKFALQEIAEAFHQDSGKNVRISYSSSGNLTRQILQGGPFELFLSANTHYVKQLYQQHKTLDQGVVFASGRIALLTLKNSSLQLDEHLSGVKQALKTGQLQRFAIANPIHAPYGVAAKEALQQLGIWKLSYPHLVLGENIAQAAQFTSSGAAQVGLVSYSLALAPVLKTTTRSLLIPASLHQPLHQSMVLLNKAGNTSKLFFDYLQQPKLYYY